MFRVIDLSFVMYMEFKECCNYGFEKENSNA